MTKIAFSNKSYDTVIIGGGAAGLFCAWQASQRGASVLLLDHGQKLAEKIRISGGGRCNFTNLNSEPKNFLSQNPKFCISALKRFTPLDFLDLVDGAGIAWHEKALGQLFCDESAQKIIQLLLQGCWRHGVELVFPARVTELTKQDSGFALSVSGSGEDAGPLGRIQARTVVIATGGLSIPKIGASGFGYEIASQFNIPLIERRPGLVPFTFTGPILESLKSLAGISLPGAASFGKTRFEDALLFTHRGLSGPAILQISSYWTPGHPVSINLLPDLSAEEWLLRAKLESPKQKLKTVLSQQFANRFAERLLELQQVANNNIADYSDKKLRQLAQNLNKWQITPAGTEGYRTAEVTLGGVDTKSLSSRTMECTSVTGLFFIGEVMDVTGHLGGHNFQWAWASAYSAAEEIARRVQ